MAKSTGNHLNIKELMAELKSVKEQAETAWRDMGPLSTVKDNEFDSWSNLCCTLNEQVLNIYISVGGSDARAILGGLVRARLMTRICQCTVLVARSLQVVLLLPLHHSAITRVETLRYLGGRLQNQVDLTQRLLNELDVVKLCIDASYAAGTVVGEVTVRELVGQIDKSATDCLELSQMIQGLIKFNDSQNRREDFLRKIAAAKSTTGSKRN